MSRWIENYQNHPFQESWTKILKLNEDIVVDDNTVATSVEEIARFNKVVIYLDNLLNSCDPELIPSATWDNFNSQCAACLKQIDAYQSNRNIGHITNANSNLDNLLTYIRPYQVVAGKAAKSASSSFSAYAKTISKSLDTFQEEASSLLSEMNELKEKATVSAKESDEAGTRVKELETEYFDDSEELGLSSRISNLETQLEENYENIRNYRTELLDGDSENVSISAEIKGALESAEKDTASVHILLDDTEERVADYNNYYVDVFGTKNDEGVTEGGLKNEITARKEHLDEFKEQQEKRYESLNDEIESLLPGATSTGLAKAYYDLKISFNKSIIIYSAMFYCSILLLMVAALFSVSQEIGWSSIEFVDITGIEKLFTNILYKIPLVLPVLWLALFATKRRSESLRLQQEYAHKEALASSYQSFKMQIETLNQSDPVLMAKLISSTIDAISNNASDTLDKKHGDKTPVHQGLDEAASSIEKLKGLFS